MQVYGLSNEQQVKGFSKDRPFRANEYLIVTDTFTGEDLVGQVVETQAYNTMQDIKSDGSTPVNMLNLLGDVNTQEHTYYQCVIKLLEPAETPIQPGSPIREPKFEEIRHLVLHGNPKDGLVLGQIKATENMGKDLPEDLRQILYLLTGDGRVIPQRGIPFIFPVREMEKYPHIGIFGGSGSGKSYTLRVVMEELMRLGIPMLVFDPHNELTFYESPPNAPEGYRDFPFEEHFRVFKIGQDCGAKFTEISTTDLVQLLGAAIRSEFTDNMVAAVEALHRRGDSLTTFAARLDAVIEARENKESGRAAGDGDLPAIDAPLSSLRSLRNRLNRLISTNIFEHGIQGVADTLAEGKTAVIQGPQYLMQVMVAYAANTLYRMRRDYVDAQFRREQALWYPPFVIAVDEAHNFAMRGDDKKAPASKLVLREIGQEGRKYGVFLLLASQRPALLDETIVAQLNTKIICRTVRAQDIQIIAQETDLSQEEMRSLPKLRSGHYYISSAIFGRTFAVQGRMAKTSAPHRPNPFDELKQIRQASTDTIREELAPIFAALENHRLTLANMAEAMELYMKRYQKSIQPSQLTHMVEELVRAGVVEKRESGYAGTIYYWKGILETDVPADDRRGAAQKSQEHSAPAAADPAVLTEYRSLLEPVFLELPQYRLDEGTMPMALDLFAERWQKTISADQLTAMVEALAQDGAVRKEDTGWLGIIYYWNVPDQVTVRPEAAREEEPHELSASDEGGGLDLSPVPVDEPVKATSALGSSADLSKPAGPTVNSAEDSAAHEEGRVTPPEAEAAAAGKGTPMPDPEAVEAYRRRLMPVFAQLPHKRLDAGSRKKALTVYRALYDERISEEELLRQVSVLVKAGYVRAEDDFLGTIYIWK